MYDIERIMVACFRQARKNSKVRGVLSFRAAAEAAYTLASSRAGSEKNLFLFAGDNLMGRFNELSESLAWSAR